MHLNLSSNGSLGLVIIVRPSLLYILEHFPTYHRPLTAITNSYRCAIYYLRRIMHIWQDDEARKFLRNIVYAMAPDSRLLIGEIVVPDKAEGVDKTVYWIGLCMLIIGGKERSVKEFSD
jgi:hypothetical protein